MEAVQRKEWYALGREATERLRRGHAPDRPGVSQLFQVLVLPAFGTGTGWEVYQDRKAATSYFAVRSIWHKEVDLARLETPVVRLRYPHSLLPTIEVRQWPLETEWVKAAKAGLQNLVIPAMVEPEVFGCDGTFYEVAFDAGFVQARYGWWEEPPAGWQALNQWLHQTLGTLQQLTSYAHQKDNL